MIFTLHISFLSEQTGEGGLKTRSPVFFCVAKTGLFLDNRILIRQIHPLCDCDEHKRVQRYAMTCQKAESEKCRLKISGGSRFRHDPQREQWYSRPVTARTVSNPSQAMRAALSDRQLGWNSRGVSSLLTVWRLPCVYGRTCISGCRGQIEMLLS